MKQKEGVFSKWIIEGKEGFVFGSDRKLYRLPFNSGPNYYQIREIKLQKPKRYKLNGVWWSQKQLKPKIKLNPNPEKIS